MNTHSSEFTRVYRQALTLLARGKWDEAIEPFSSLAAVRPEDPGIQVGLGWCYLSTDRPDEAEAAFRRGLSCEPDNVTALLGSSTALLRLEDYFEAASQVEKGLKLEPRNSELLLIRVATLLGTGRRKAASFLVRRLLESETGLDRGLLNLGLSLFHSGQFTHSGEMARLCLKHQPDSVDFLALLGASEIRDGLVQSGMETLDRILELAPGHPFACRERDRARRVEEGLGDFLPD
jgi:Flp pilus assembly protein TadD